MLDDFFQQQARAARRHRRQPVALQAGRRRRAGRSTRRALADFQRARADQGGVLPQRRQDAVVQGRHPRARDGDGLKEIDLDIDGQALKFARRQHDAGDRAPGRARASPRRSSVDQHPAGTPLVFDGPWALFRLFDRFDVQPTPQPERFTVPLNLDGQARPARGHGEQRLQSVSPARDAAVPLPGLAVSPHERGREPGDDDSRLVRQAADAGRFRVAPARGRLRRAVGHLARRGPAGAARSAGRSVARCLSAAARPGASS